MFSALAPGECGLMDTSLLLDIKNGKQAQSGISGMVKVLDARVVCIWSPSLQVFSQ